MKGKHLEKIRRNISLETNSSSNSLYAVVEISKKISELLEEHNFNNNELLITKEHIQNKINELIEILSKRINQTSLPNKKISNLYIVDERGKLIIKKRESP
jgi:type II restriction/modification system DNA methylase subunit YeeA